ncbi:MAG: hypothetical protein AAF570_02555 [Bacteroidota bacterium]
MLEIRLKRIVFRHLRQNRIADVMKRHDIPFYCIRQIKDFTIYELTLRQTEIALKIYEEKGFDELFHALRRPKQRLVAKSEKEMWPGHARVKRILKRHPWIEERHGVDADLVHVLFENGSIEGYWHLGKLVVRISSLLDFLEQHGGPNG